MSKARIGIDVGGTFTHGVAIDESHNVVAKACYPTTHSAAEGVALGVLEVLRMLLKDARLTPEDISLVAHSTTQATNALLEGDVCTVGVLAAGSGLSGKKVKADTSFAKVTISKESEIPVVHVYVDEKQLQAEELNRTLKALQARGAQSVVGVTAFSVDKPEYENMMGEAACSLKLPFTATHEISQLYGIKIRTRTAIVNASILPKMTETANRTREAVEKMGLACPFLIMRSDGGVMSAQEMQKRPVLTILSGPAAGVAAALMYEKMAYGIFIEVGGTSTDISLVKDGKPEIRSATVGNHHLYLQTLDVRTVGVAGGSLLSIASGRVVSVGPRSAHIGGFPYACFAKNASLSSSRLETCKEKQNLVVENEMGEKYALTPTCAANALNLLKTDDYAKGSTEEARAAFKTAGKELNREWQDVAGEALDAGARLLVKIVEELMQDYCLPRDLTVLVGGGGAAGVWVPLVAKKMDLPYHVVNHPEVISSIGVAHAFLREFVERVIVAPTQEDILQVKGEVRDRILRQGAHPETVTVDIRLDPAKHTVRAVATGALKMQSMQGKQFSEEEMKQTAGNWLRGDVRCLGGNDFFKVFGREENGRQKIAVMDIQGALRLVRSDVMVFEAPKEFLQEKLKHSLEKFTQYGDAGALLPQLFVLAGTKLLDLSRLGTEEQMLGYLDTEIQELPAGETFCVVVARE